MQKHHSELRFWHKVKLNNGEYTNGIADVSNSHWFHFNEIDFKNKTVLDIGCWDGYFSFEAEKRGAKKVVSLDNPEFRWGGMDGYNFLHNHFNSSAEFVLGSIYDLDKIFKEKQFDIVLCFGVLYHLTDPLLAMKNVFHVCSNTASFEGLMVEDKSEYLKLIKVGEINNDPSNCYCMSSGYADYISHLCGFSVQNYKWYCDRGSFICKRQEGLSCDFYRMAGFNSSKTLSDNQVDKLKSFDIFEKNNMADEILERLKPEILEKLKQDELNKVIHDSMEFY